MFIDAPDFMIGSIDWTPNSRSSSSASVYTGKRSIAANPWFSQLTANVHLEPCSSDDARLLRSFFFRCRGSTNNFRIAATERKQNDNAGVTASVAAAAGDATLHITGYSTPLLEGQFLTVNGQLCCCAADQVGDEVTFEPKLRAAVSVGTNVVTSRPYALVHLTASPTWNLSGNSYSFSFGVEEALLEADGAVLPEGAVATIEALAALSPDASPVLWSPTREPLIWSISAEQWLRENRIPILNIARFDGAAGTPLEQCSFDQWCAARDFAAAMTFRRLSSSAWIQLDGAGGAAPTTDTAFSKYWLDGAMEFALGCSDAELYIDVVPGGDNNGRPFVGRTDGRNYSGVRIDTSRGAIQIVDHVYGAAAGDMQVRADALIPGFNALAQVRVYVSFIGNEVTAWEPVTGVTIKAASAVAFATIGVIFSRRHTTTFRELGYAPRDFSACSTIGGMRFLGSRGIHADAEGGIFNGLNYPDHALVIYGTESNASAGTVTGPMTINLGRLERSDGSLTPLCLVDSNSDDVTNDRLFDIEGDCIFEADDVPHIAVGDRTQVAGEPVWLYRAADPEDLTVGHWPRTQINTQGVINHECVLPLDLDDGITRLICTYQGSPVLTGGDAGGVIMLTHLGGDTLDEANWSCVQLVLLPGAWGLPKSDDCVIRPVDLFGDGRRIIVFGSRLNSRNTAGLGGVYWIDLDEGGGPDVPNKTAHAMGGVGLDVTMVDFVDLGAGHGLDVAYSATASTAGGDNNGAGTLALLTNPRVAAGAWASTIIATPSGRYAWNLANSGHKSGGKSVLLAVFDGTIDPIGALNALWWNGAAWTFTVLDQMPVGHTFEKPFLFKFRLSNGIYLRCGGDDSGNKELAFAFFEESAALPVVAAAPAAGFEPETNAIIAAMLPAPDAKHQAAIDRCVKRLKGCGAWQNSIDVFYMLAAQAAQHSLINWKNPGTYTAVPVNAPLFIADGGYAFDGATNYLDTTYDPSVSSLGFALNDAHIGAYALTSTNGAGPDVGTADKRSQLRIVGTTGYSFGLNLVVGGSNAGAPLPVVPTPCHLLVARAAPNATAVYVNGELNQVAVTASNGLSGRLLIGSDGASFSPRQIGAAHFGRAPAAYASFTADQVAQEVSLAIQLYMADLGRLG